MKKYHVVFESNMGDEMTIKVLAENLQELGIKIRQYRAIFEKETKRIVSIEELNLKVA